MHLKINALGDYKKKYDPFARLLALKRGVGVCSVVGVVSGFYGNYDFPSKPRWNTVLFSSLTNGFKVSPIRSCSCNTHHSKQTISEDVHF